MFYALQLASFAILWIMIVYAFNSLLARRYKKPKLKRTVTYVFAVATIGVFGEIFLDAAYNHFVGNPLWEYRILPVHGGYTSSFALVTWGIYGFHLSLLHDTLRRHHIYSFYKLALIMSVEALFAEALLTLSAKLFLGEFLYYYFPGDLWHISSFQNIPFYFICALVVITTVRRFKVDPAFFACMCASFVTVLIFIV